jgi:hypothetical protein
MRAKIFVESYMKAWNERDAKKVADHLSPSTYMTIPG